MILFNVHLLIAELVKISFLFIICYWFFYIPVHKGYQNGKDESRDFCFVCCSFGQEAKLRTRA